MSVGIRPSDCREESPALRGQRLHELQHAEVRIPLALHTLFAILPVGGGIPLLRKRLTLLVCLLVERHVHVPHAHGETLHLTYSRSCKSRKLLLVLKNLLGFVNDVPCLVRKFGKSRVIIILNVFRYFAIYPIYIRVIFLQEVKHLTHDVYIGISFIICLRLYDVLP